MTATGAKINPAIYHGGEIRRRSKTEGVILDGMRAKKINSLSLIILSNFSTRPVL